MSQSNTIKTLITLIEVSKDGENGFLGCANEASDPELAAVLRACARECHNAATELQELIRVLGGDPHAGGHATGAVRSGWGSMKAAAASPGDRAVLAECERGEEHVRGVYQAALNENLPPDVYKLVAAQYLGVLKNHERVKTRCHRMGR
jgi:uncharacterized protein (TIGR02284 family)